MSIENYKAIMLLHALGDTIGFKNGEWEFNFFNHDLSYKTTLEIVFQFISLGGITSIDLKDWNVSDDTLIHIALAKTLLDKDKDKKEIFKKNLIKTLQKIRDDEGNQENDENEKITLEKIKKVKFRGVGFTTVTSVEAWNEDKDISYKTSGGNGVAMRTLCVGAYYNKEKDLDKLIKFPPKRVFKFYILQFFELLHFLNHIYISTLKS
jgi:ADP-ribosylarginine hydrolase